MTPRLLTFAQQNDWVGRRVLDLGCGTGGSLLWLLAGRQGFTVTGVDSSTTMLKTLQVALKEREMASMLLHQDIRALDVQENYDMVLALDVINELDSLKDLEMVFRNVAAHMNPRNFFVFDLHTISGLAQMGASGDRLIQNTDDLTAVLSSAFDYERQVYSGDYVVFQRAGTQWVRDAATRLLRAYPIQAVATLLRRSGFEIKEVLDETLNPLSGAAPSSTRRVIFAAIRQ